MKNKNLLLKVFTTLVLCVYCLKKEFMATAILVKDRDFEIYDGSHLIGEAVGFVLKMKELSLLTN